MRNQLRVYFGPQDEQEAVGPEEGRITVPLTEILPLLADAYDNGRTWVRDFAEDHITISSDLYDVLMAYRHFRRPSA